MVVVCEVVVVVVVEMFGTTVTLDESSSLSAAFACSGGVEVVNLMGKIVCDNILDVCLCIVYENGILVIWVKIFGESSVDVFARERVAVFVFAFNLIVF